MSNAAPGWYRDPSGSDQLRWWDGGRWTAQVTPSASAAPTPASGRSSRRVAPWVWILIAVAILLVSVLLAPLAVVIALVVLVTAIVGLTRGTRTWLRLRSPGVAGGALAGAVLVLALSGAVSAASAINASTPQTVSQPRGFADATKSSAPEHVTPTRTATPTRTPTPKRTPTTVVREETVKEAIPFDRVSVEDASIPRAQSAVTRAGQNGERTLTYRVTLIDGVETGRELTSDVVTVTAVTEITAVGTYDPPPAPPADAVSECDVNYADACVPVASDVDCAWGSGNGPAYFDGVARVVGIDIYDLDRDGDGLACER